jgi:hypothetical protein
LPVGSIAYTCKIGAKGELLYRSMGVAAMFALDQPAQHSDLLLVKCEKQDRTHPSALHKLELSTYGICEICSDTFNPARLKALPFATTCIRCKRQLEGEARRKA